MPLFDHHHKPLDPLVQWQSMHTSWMTLLAFDLNRELPKPYFWAVPSRHLGIEVDVAALEGHRDPSNGKGPLNWTATYTAPAATAVLPFAPAVDELEVRVFEDSNRGLRLVGAVEFLSPANKDRPDTRAAFVSKCHGYLQLGVGVVMIDTVTDKHFNLHNDLLDRLGQPGPRLDGHLYATSYRPTGKNGVGELAVWAYPLAVGGDLPTVPFWLLGGVCVPARLADTYDEVCRNLAVYDLLRLPAAARS